MNESRESVWYRSHYSKGPLYAKADSDLTELDLSLEYERHLMFKEEQPKTCPVCECVTFRESCPFNCKLPDGSPSFITGDTLVDDILRKRQAGLEEPDLDAMYPNKPRFDDPKEKWEAVKSD